MPRIYDDEKNKGVIPRSAPVPEDLGPQYTEEPEEEVVGGAYQQPTHSKKPKLDGKRLRQREESPDDTDSDSEDDSPPSRRGSAGGSGAQDSPTKREAAASPGFVKKQLKAAPASTGKLTGSGKKKALLALGLGGIIPLVFAMLLFFSFLGPLKGIHFETILRSAAFAQFQRNLSKVYSQTLFDSATLTEGSTGRAKLGDRSLIQKLRGVNPEKRLAELGRENKLKFDITGERRWGGLQKVNRFNGVVIEGKNYNLNEYARKSFGKDYNKLSKRERWTVESKFTSDVRIGLDDMLANHKLSYRSSVYNGLRQVAGLSMTKWANKAKDYAGKTPKEATKANLDETVKTVTGSDGAKVKSGAASVSDEEVKDYKDRVTEAAANGEPTGDVKPNAKLLKRIKVANKVSDAAFLTTLACIVNDVNTAIREGGKQTETNALALGHNTLTASDQIKTGESVSEAINADAKRWNGAENSALYKQDTGEENLEDGDYEQLAGIPPIFQPQYIKNITGTVDAILDNLVTGGMAVIINKLPGGEEAVDTSKTAACRVILSEIAQNGMAAVELGAAVLTLGSVKGATKAATEALKMGFSFAAGYGVGVLLGKQLDRIIQSYAGLDYSGVAVGADNYNQTKMGMNYLSSVGQRNTNFGRPMNDAEYVQSQEAAMAELRTAYNSKPIMERYFALDNPFSLTGKLVAHLPASFTELGSSFSRTANTVVSNAMNPLTLASSASGPFSAKAKAEPTRWASGSIVGLQEFGWTEEELDAISKDPAFSSTELEDFMASGDNMQRLDEQFKPCYDYHMQSQAPEDDNCSAEALSTPDAMKWRWYNALLQQADQAAKTIEEITSDQGSGVATGTASSSGTDFVGKFSSSDNIPCPANTKDLGTVKSRFANPARTDTPGQIMLRLCQLSSIGGAGNDTSGQRISGGAVVSSLAADRFQKLGEKYQQDHGGSKLSAGSSFRLGDSRGGRGDGVSAAKPGMSMHQLGVAIDFANIGGSLGSSRSCSGRKTMPGNQYWDWLAKNAASFGIRQYSAEAWHWDILAAGNRC
ncbi:hypothetical protein CR970_01070 [Candidatus Saccharibacteria bacterium]|nr:MAG: hypothetical protein CR970_01070 [Candidatus Saccharibacteria bacterium]